MHDELEEMAETLVSTTKKAGADKAGIPVNSAS